MTEQEQEIMEALAISSDLRNEFSMQPGHFAHYAFQHARAEDMVRKCEERVDMAFAELYAEYRKKHPDAKENDCKSFIRQSVRHKKALKGLNAAKLMRDILKAAVRAFEIRRDMLIQLGADHRAEFTTTDVGMKKKIARATKVVRKTVRNKPKRKRKEL